MSKDQVSAVLDDVYAAWAKNDADAFVESYAEDASAVLPGARLRDREAIRTTMAEVFAGPLKGSSATHEVHCVRFLGDDVAMVYSESATLLAGATEPTGAAVDLWLLSEVDGRWLVKAFHSCPA